MTIHEDPAALRHWLTLMALWRRYFSYTVEGMEQLATHECRVVVGYHGRPLAFDLFLLGAEIHRRQGYIPVALMHRKLMNAPYSRWLIDGLDWATGRGPVLEQAVAEGRHIIIAPGGELEGLRPGWVREQVRWGDHFGYLTFAIKRGLAIVPAAAAGVDSAYYGLMDSTALAARLGFDKARRAEFEARRPALARIVEQLTPLWVGLGPLGPFPASPPFPVKVHQIIGEAITPADYADIDPSDPEALATLHREVQTRVQDLLIAARRTISTERSSRFNNLRETLSPTSLTR